MFLKQLIRSSPFVTHLHRNMAELQRLGLSEAKVKETLKNASLTQQLGMMIEFADKKNVKIDKNTGTLIYSLATKCKKSSHANEILNLVIEKKILSDTQIIAAINYLTAHPVSYGQLELEAACGVGVVITEDQIRNAVKAELLKNKSKLDELHHRFNIGPLIASIKKDLKWADGGLVKKIVDEEVFNVLGPKTQVNNSSSKKDKAQPKPQIKSQPEKAPAEEEICELNFSHLHKPGENYTTDGYVVTNDTMRLMKEHLEFTKGQWRTRFPPEPNGILHIGHAKAINVNFGAAKAHGGICFLRYDDTNPEKEEAKFFESILDIVQWLGYTPYKVTHSSDYFQQLYELAVKLIRDGNAYVCHQTADELKGFNVKFSPWRDRPVEESLSLFEDMKNGKIDEGAATLRMKCRLEEGKLDPVAYRIKFVEHHRTGHDWCIYPTYDYTHCLCDSFENISHSLCTKEFQSRRSSYYWLCNALRVYCPVQWEYGRLNIGYTIMSKRKIAKLIANNVVADYDDPRLFTLTALRRRGFPPQAINKFVKKLGLTGALTLTEPALLEAVVRDELNHIAERVMAVLEPLKLTVLESAQTLPHTVNVPDIPGKDPTHPVTISDVIYIDASDFRLSADKDYRRFAKDQAVGLKHVGLVASVVSIEQDTSGTITNVNVKLEQLSKDNKPKAFIQWVCGGVPAQVRNYTRLFNHQNPEDTEQVPGGYLSDINPNSLKVYNGLVEARIAKQPPLSRYQFERIGYYCVDQDSTDNRLVFNNTVSLREDKAKS